VATSSVGAPSAAVTATVRLFVSLGQRDGIGPGDLVGAITGESGIEGKQIGRIDLRESFSLVEVEAAVADRVIKALNGTTVKGRSVRVDLDRNERARGSGRPSGGGSRRPAGRGGPRRG
jgi:ATP-dependent RNA helicase DeaD